MVSAKAVVKPGWVAVFSAVMILAFGWVLTTYAEATDLRPSSEVVPKEYFGLHIHRASTSTPWPNAGFGVWRLWDAYVNWPHLEKSKGHWDFTKLDQYVALAEKKNVSVSLPLGLTPRWASSRPDELSSYGPGLAAEPRNIEDWRDYVRTVAARYRSRIRVYEIWGEPNLKGFFTGDTDQMLVLAREAYAIIKKIDPSALVVSPATTGGGAHLNWLDEYLKKGGGEVADVIGYHFYVSPAQPEAMLPIIRNVRNLMSKYGIAKPLWNTESGWIIESAERSVDPAVVGFAKNTKSLSSDESKAYVSRALILGWAAGLKRFYWYAWDNISMGLIENESKRPKPAAVSYSQTLKWLVGSTMENCSSESGEEWVCAIRKAPNRRAWLLWRTQERVSHPLPREWKAVEYQTLDGKSYPIASSNATVTVDQTPILVKADTLRW